MHTKNKLPIMYHPTNVVFLDDESVFLNRICNAIDKSIPYIKIQDPLQALDYLGVHAYTLDFFTALIHSSNIDRSDTVRETENFDINFSVLRSQLGRSNRFKKVTVVFVDQLMPTVKGIEFCKQVREKNILVKLILLTGNAEKDEVIDAFNKGVIDGYLPKNSPDLVQLINEHATRYAWSQFLDFSSSLLGLISPLVKPLYDEAFFNFFEYIMKKECVSEFYLLDSNCSFLFFTDAGMAKKLLLLSEEDFEEFHELAEDSGAPEDVLTAIQHKEHVPVTVDYKSYLRLKGDNWRKVMQECHKVVGTEIYYTLIHEPDAKVFSFKRYFAEEWKPKLA